MGKVYDHAKISELVEQVREHADKVTANPETELRDVRAALLAVVAQQALLAEAVSRLDHGLAFRPSRDWSG